MELAACAVAMPWLPEDAVMTALSSPSDVILLAAPRILKDPVSWKFSALKETEEPVSRPIWRDGNRGVSKMCGRMRRRA
jgi:hypothetical protein